MRVAGSFLSIITLVTCIKAIRFKSHLEPIRLWSRLHWSRQDLLCNFCGIRDSDLFIKDQLVLDLLGCCEGCYVSDLLPFTILIKPPCITLSLPIFSLPSLVGIIIVNPLISCPLIPVSWSSLGTWYNPNDPSSPRLSLPSDFAWFFSDGTWIFMPDSCSTETYHHYTLRYSFHIKLVIPNAYVVWNTNKPELLVVVVDIKGRLAFVFFEATWYSVTIGAIA